MRSSGSYYGLNENEDLDQHGPYATSSRIMPCKFGGYICDADKDNYPWAESQKCKSILVFWEKFSMFHPEMWWDVRMGKCLVVEHNAMFNTK